MEYEQSRQVAVELTEREGETKAEAAVYLNGHMYSGHGVARCKPTDFEVAGIGQELAMSRALADLSGHLLEAAATDIEAIEGEPVRLRA
jgi:hypothetical protein